MVLAEQLKDVPDEVESFWTVHEAAAYQLNCPVCPPDCPIDSQQEFLPFVDRVITNDGSTRSKLRASVFQAERERKRVPRSEAVRSTALLQPVL